MTPELLSKNRMFSVASTDILSWLAGICQEREYAKNQDVAHKGEAATDLLFLLQGRLMVMDTAHDGQMVGLQLLLPGDCFGELSALDGQPRAVSLRAVEDSWVGSLPRPAFLELLDRSPAVSRYLLNCFAGAIRASNRHRIILSLGNVQRRVAALLLSYSSSPDDGNNGVQVIPRLPAQHELAAMANTSRESVSRVIRALQEKGLVEKQGRELRITKPDELERLVQQDA